MNTINEVHSIIILGQRAYLHGGIQLVPCVFISIKQQVCFSFHSIQGRFSRWIKPRTTSLLLGTFADITRGKSELLAENALLRYQLVILRRQIKRPVYKKRDRLLLVLLAGMVRTWKQALFLVQPETLLGFHRELFGVFWKRKSKAHSRKPRLSPEMITLIKEMAVNNRLWGAERIRGELLKLDIRVSKRTIQKFMRHVRTTQPRGQNWRTFLRNHAQRHGPVISSRSLISSSVRFLRFSSSSCSRERSSMSM